jgi:hypothetical protein
MSTISTPVRRPWKSRAESALSAPSARVSALSGCRFNKRHHRPLEHSRTAERSPHGGDSAKLERPHSRLIRPGAIQECMKLTLFQSTIGLGVFGFTRDETGANLPADLGSWTTISGAV